MLKFFAELYPATFFFGAIVGGLFAIIFNKRVQAGFDNFNVRLYRRTGYTNRQLAKLVTVINFLPPAFMIAVGICFKTILWMPIAACLAEGCLIYSFFASSKKLYNDGASLSVNKEALGSLNYWKFYITVYATGLVFKYCFKGQWVDALLLFVLLDLPMLLILYLVCSPPFMRKKRKIRIKALLRLAKRKLRGIKLPTPAPWPRPVTS